MRGSLFPLDVYGLLFHYLDGRNLATWMQTCKTLNEYIINRPELILRVSMRISYCNTRNELQKAMFHTDLVDYLNSKKIWNWLKDQIKEITGTEPWDSFEANQLRFIQSKNGQYTYIIRDGFTVRNRFLNIGMYLETHFNNFFRVMGTALYPLRNRKFYKFADDIGIGNGNVTVIRFTNNLNKQVHQEQRVIDATLPFTHEDALGDINDWKLMVENEDMSRVVSVIIKTQDTRFTFPMEMTIAELKRTFCIDNSEELGYANEIYPNEMTLNQARLLQRRYAIAVIHFIK